MPCCRHFVEERGRNEEGPGDAKCLQSSRKNCPTQHVTGVTTRNTERGCLNHTVHLGLEEWLLFVCSG